MVAPCEDFGRRWCWRDSQEPSRWRVSVCGRRWRRRMRRKWDGIPRLLNRKLRTSAQGGMALYGMKGMRWERRGRRWARFLVRWLQEADPILPGSDAGAGLAAIIGAGSLLAPTLRRSPPLAETVSSLRFLRRAGSSMRSRRGGNFMNGVREEDIAERSRGRS